MPTPVQAYIIFLLCSIALIDASAFLALLRRRHENNRIHGVVLPRMKPTECYRVCLLRAAARADGGVPPADEDEWRAMLAAFQMYKAAYGNLNVPLRFTVPALAPWPEKAWGLKLGQRVAAIRSTGKYVHDEKRRKVLDDMGFVWRLRAASSETDDDKSLSFDQLYTAMVTYREYIQKGKGPISIPSGFVVPDCDPWPQYVRGLPLGKMMAGMRSKAFLAANRGAQEKLNAVGFQFDGKVAANDSRFQLVYDALKRYKELYGDLLVPQPFVVPENSKDWPETTWGLRLGARVNAIRSQGTFLNSHPDRREMLDRLGFFWSPSNAELGNRRGRRRKDEVEEIESKPDAPEEQSAASMQTEKADDPYDNTLEALFGDSFDFDKGPLGLSGDEVGNDQPKWGLEGGRRLDDAEGRAESEAEVSDEYKPPPNLAASLAEAAERAAAVGVIKEMNAERRIVKGKREKDIPWFNDDFGGEFVFDDVVEALTVYRSIHGDFSNLTDGSYVVPSRGDEFAYLDSTFGKFGNNDASSRAAAALVNFGKGRRLATSEADSLYGEFEDFDNDSPEVDVVGTSFAPAIAGTPDDWPEHLWGMALGNIVERIRDGCLEVKHLPARKRLLDELGFDWGDPKHFIDVPFEKAMCAMYAYYLVRGDMFVYRDFVMPDEDPWPQALAGYEIGEAVHRIRELQSFLEAYHPEKVSLLRMIDFVWFPTLALALDPDEGEMTPELTLLCALGHPDYTKMHDIPMGLTEKIMADGPFFESDNPRYWWRRWHNWDYVRDYWYQQGRRDNAFALRQMGYPQMADEHEAKYGPGLFTRINETLAVLEDGIERMSADDRMALKEKIEFFRQEMTECTDIPPWERKSLLEDLDSYLFELSAGQKGLPADGEAEVDYENEYAHVEVETGSFAEEEYEDEANGEEETYEDEEGNEDKVKLAEEERTIGLRPEEHRSKS